MTRPYQTKNIEQAATIQTVTLLEPAISFDSSGLATFSFPATPEVIELVLRYDSGIQADARKLLNSRNRLYKLIRREAR